MNPLAPVNPKLVDVFPKFHDGYPAVLAAEDTPDMLRDACGDAAVSFPDSMWIEPREWKERAEYNTENNLWGVNFVDRFTHQGNSHECSTHALTRIAEAARNRARGIKFPEGPKKGFRYPASATSGSVWLAPLSIYAEANPSVRGGSNIQHCLRIAQKRGFLPEPMQPAEYNFRHTLVGTAGGRGSFNQSAGSWVGLRNFPAGFTETSNWFRPTEVIVGMTWEQGICVLLHGLGLEYGRKGHAVPPLFWNATSNVVGYVDSYERILYDSISTFKSSIRGAICIVSMTHPNDWSNPVG